MLAVADNQKRVFFGVSLCKTIAGLKEKKFSSSSNKIYTVVDAGIPEGKKRTRIVETKNGTINQPSTMQDDASDGGKREQTRHAS